MTTAGVTVTVQLGADWTQTWTVPEVPGDADDATVELVNTQGCVLDGLTADWDTPDGWLGQPAPTVVSLSVFVPAGAASRPDLTGRGRVVIYPPDYDPDTGDDPLLDVVGKLGDGDATPTRDGLSYAVTLSDPLADLGESRLGGSEWPEQYHLNRMQRLKSLMKQLGLKWDAGQMPSEPEIDKSGPLWIYPPQYAIAYGTTPGVYGSPVFPKVTVEPAPTNEVLDGHLAGMVKWEGQTPVTLQDYRMAGVFEWDYYLTHPPATSHTRYYMRPIVVPHTDEEWYTEYRTAWVTIRRSDNVGLPMLLEADGTITERAEEGTIPDWPNQGAWVPACAIDRDSIVWRVDKERHPNAVRLSGWWADYSNPIQGQMWSREDVAYERPYHVAAYGRVEKQLDLPFMQDEEHPTPANNYPDYLAYAHLGFHYDSQARYTVESFTIVPEAIDNPRAWPRLFQQRAQDTWGRYFDCAAGRLLHVYGVNPDWHPEGRTRFHGQLVGASLSLESGRLRLTPRVVQRRPGPMGPGYVGSVTWEDMDPALTWEDMDPAWTWIDAWMTTTPAA